MMYIQTLLLAAGIAVIALAVAPLMDWTHATLEETEQVAALGQTHQLELALELYYLEHGEYPNVSGRDLPLELFQAGVLRSDSVPTPLRYHSDGVTYDLALR